MAALSYPFSVVTYFESYASAEIRISWWLITDS